MNNKKRKNPTKKIIYTATAATAIATTVWVSLLHETKIKNEKLFRLTEEVKQMVSDNQHKIIHFAGYQKLLNANKKGIDLIFSKKQDIVNAQYDLLSNYKTSAQEYLDAYDKLEKLINDASAIDMSLVPTSMENNLNNILKIAKREIGKSNQTTPILEKVYKNLLDSFNNVVKFKEERNDIVDKYKAYQIPDVSKANQKYQGSLKKDKNQMDFYVNYKEATISTLKNTFSNIKSDVQKALENIQLLETAKNENDKVLGKIQETKYLTDSEKTELQSKEQRLYDEAYKPDSENSYIYEQILQMNLSNVLVPANDILKRKELEEEVYQDWILPEERKQVEQLKENLLLAIATAKENIQNDNLNNVKEATRKLDEYLSNLHHTYDLYEDRKYSEISTTLADNYDLPEEVKTLNDEIKVLMQDKEANRKEINQKTKELKEKLNDFVKDFNESRAVTSEKFYEGYSKLDLYKNIRLNTMHSNSSSQLPQNELMGWTDKNNSKLNEEIKKLSLELFETKEQIKVLEAQTKQDFKENEEEAFKIDITNIREPKIPGVSLQQLKDKYMSVIYNVSRVYRESLLKSLKDTADFIDASYTILPKGDFMRMLMKAFGYLTASKEDGTTFGRSGKTWEILQLPDSEFDEAKLPDFEEIHKPTNYTGVTDLDPIYHTPEELYWNTMPYILAAKNLDDFGYFIYGKELEDFDEETNIYDSFPNKKEIIEYFKQISDEWNEEMDEPRRDEFEDEESYQKELAKWNKYELEHSEWEGRFVKFLNSPYSKDATLDTFKKAVNIDAMLSSKNTVPWFGENDNLGSMNGPSAFNSAFTFYLFSLNTKYPYSMQQLSSAKNLFQISRDDFTKATVKFNEIMNEKVTEIQAKLNQISSSSLDFDFSTKNDSEVASQLQKLLTVPEYQAVDKALMDKYKYFQEELIKPGSELMNKLFDELKAKYESSLESTKLSEDNKNKFRDILTQNTETFGKKDFNAKFVAVANLLNEYQELFNLTK
ncbi:hypothetical protein [Mycoplasma buteonis]|uniref:hypothetical protein n=1 Tax=Mycoplasma buteonis TaxID=171280 RepID=UPI00056D731D|nr:hypothetical protein [Mycoplasma buteonis]